MNELGDLMGVKGKKAVEGSSFVVQIFCPGFTRAISCSSCTNNL